MIIADGYLIVKSNFITFTNRSQIHICWQARSDFCIFPPEFFEKSLYEQKKLLYNILRLLKGAQRVNCLKCGVKTQDDHAFCDSCLEVMARYPVKPGTVVQLPRRSRFAEQRRAVRRKPEPEPEEQIIAQRRIIKWMAITIAVLVLLLCICGISIYNLLGHDISIDPPTGRNYSTVITQ
jgi:hypothetical protein